MKLHGLQKMTLLDFPGRVACTVFLGGCDFRCPFCHNFELVDGTEPPVMEDTEFFDFLESRKGLLDGVAVTGGEPCLHRDLPAFLERVRAMGFATTLDTAGYHPDLLKELLDRGLLDYIAMDIKNAPEKYAVTCGVETVDLEKVRASIKLIMESGVPYEFRTTVVKELHEPEDFLSIGALIEGAEKYFLQQFTDRETVPFDGLHAPAPEELDRYAALVAPFVKNAEVRGVD